MKKEGFKYLAKVCSDGRLYNGAWYHISFLPVPEPNEAVFDEFPRDWKRHELQRLCMGRQKTNLQPA